MSRSFRHEAIEIAVILVAVVAWGAVVTAMVMGVQAWLGAAPAVMVALTCIWATILSLSRRFH